MYCSALHPDPFLWFALSTQLTSFCHATIDCHMIGLHKGFVFSRPKETKPWPDEFRKTWLTVIQITDSVKTNVNRLKCVELKKSSLKGWLRFHLFLYTKINLGCNFGASLEHFRISFYFLEHFRTPLWETLRNFWEIPFLRISFDV